MGNKGRDAMASLKVVWAGELRIDLSKELENEEEGVGLMPREYHRL